MYVKPEIKSYSEADLELIKAGCCTCECVCECVCECERT